MRGACRDTLRILGRIIFSAYRQDRVLMGKQGSYLDINCLGSLQAVQDRAEQ